MIDTERKAEQQHLDVLYARLDELRVRGERALDSVRRQQTAGTPAARSERDAFVDAARRPAGPAAVGRGAALLRPARPARRRAPVHRPDRAVRRRAPAAAGRLAGAGGRAVLPGHRGRGRTGSSGAGSWPPATGRSIGIEDEVLDLDASTRSGTAAGRGRRGRAARGARRRPHRPDARHRRHHPGRAGPGDPRAAAGVLVVQGGPGTGKTAVALHRAAYLLYTHRERLARPACWSSARTSGSCATSTQVLPSLGEAEASCWSTPGRLYPGVDAVAERGPRSPRSRATCGWRRCCRRAVRDRQRVSRAGRAARRRPDRGRLRPGDVRAALERARRTGKPHNAARVTFVKYLLGQLAAPARRRRGRWTRRSGPATSPTCASPGTCAAS